MEKGEPSNAAPANKKRRVPSTSTSRDQPRVEYRATSQLSQATMSKIAQQTRRGKRDPQSISTFLDIGDHRYGWLLPGWVVEERRMPPCFEFPTGRLYRYYYDPSGRLYRTKHEMLSAWAKKGINFIG